MKRKSRLLGAFLPILTILMISVSAALACKSKTETTDMTGTADSTKTFTIKGEIYCFGDGVSDLIREAERNK